MTGLPSNRCPECGQIALRTDQERQQRAVKDALTQLQNTPEILRTGLYLAPASVVVFFVLWLAGFGGLARLLGVFMAVAVMGTGLQVFRVKRLPAWAVETMEAKPNYRAAVLLVIVGAALVALCVAMP